MPRRVPCGVCADGSARERGEFARGVGSCALLSWKIPLSVRFSAPSHVMSLRSGEVWGGALHR